MVAMWAADACKCWAATNCTEALSTAKGYQRVRYGRGDVGFRSDAHLLLASREGSIRAVGSVSEDERGPVTILLSAALQQRGGEGSERGGGVPTARSLSSVSDELLVGHRS